MVEAIKSTGEIILDEDELENAKKVLREYCDAHPDIEQPELKRNTVDNRAFIPDTEQGIAVFKAYAWNNFVFRSKVARLQDKASRSGTSQEISRAAVAIPQAPQRKAGTPRKLVTAFEINNKRVDAIEQVIDDAETAYGPTELVMNGLEECLVSLRVKRGVLNAIKREVAQPSKNESLGNEAG